MSVVRAIPARSEAVSDAALLGRISEGDIAALGFLYDRYAAALVRYASRFDRSDAEDVVQTVFMRVLRIAQSYRPDAQSARPWLFAITARVLQERSRAVRRFGRAMFQLSNDSRKPSAPPSDARHDLQRGLARLPRAKSIVLLLNEVEGFSCEEIAAMLEIPIGTVWTRLHHARRELRGYYHEEDDHESR
jgi:RNA polymerase sigma factor (sigma-70 family)